MCQNVWFNTMHFVLRGLTLGRIICAMDKEMKCILDIGSAATQGVYRILEIVIKLLLFQMSITNSKTCKELCSWWGCVI